MDDTNWAAEYEQRHPYLTELANRLAEKVESALDSVPHIDRIAFRVKDPKSFAMKAAEPRYKRPLVEIEDQLAGRVITFFRSDMGVVCEQLEKWLGAVERETKEPAGPSEFGYETEHYVFVIPENAKPEGWDQLDSMPTTFEMQIRTLFMHAWAEPQHDLGYKSDLGDSEKRKLAWIAASAWGADQMLDDLARYANSDGLEPTKSRPAGRVV